MLYLAPSSLPAQNIRGTVKYLDRGVSDALVVLDDGASNTVTDSTGIFVFENVSPGRHSVSVRHLQYEEYFGSYQHSSAKDLVVTIVLTPSSIELDEVAVTEVRALPRRGLYEITEEETRLYPGTFFDPARFAASFPGVQVANDQTNQLAIRGMHPDLMQWHIEGLEILNPNNLANAGTAADRPTLSGGSVNILSNQLLSQSSLLSMSDPGFQGNAISGIMDMHFRKGNSAQREHTAQIGLLGIEAATEGPFKQGSESSYLVNARYSTVGLITALGVDFGDEDIQFADLSFTTDFPLGRGALKVFGFGGISSNKHPQLAFEEWEEDRDFKDIDFSSSTGTLGASFTQPLGEQLLLSIRGAFSANRYDRRELWPEDIEAGDPATVEHANEEGQRSKFSALAMINAGLGRTGNLRVAVNFIHDQIDIEGFFGTRRFNGNGSNTLVRPYVEFSNTVLERLRYTLGLGVSFYSLTEDVIVEPAASLRWDFNDRHAIAASWRISSQALNDVYLLNSPDNGQNSSFEAVRSMAAELDYTAALGDGTLQVSAFYYMLSSLPEVPFPSNSPDDDFSPLNLNLFLTVDQDLRPGSEATVVGVSAGYRRNFRRGYYTSINGSVFNSEYTLRETDERPTTFDTDFTIYLSGGKEWTRQKDYGLRTWGLTGAFIGRGGLKTGTIDPERSEEAGFTVHVPNSQGSQQIDGYNRVDIRLYWRKDKKNHASTWSIDIQNLLNTGNAWLPTYDFLLREVRQTTQLGIVPVLNYRIDF